MGKGLEFQFCTAWDGWDEVDTFCLQFYDAKLVPAIQKIVGWDVAECMTVDCENCVVSFVFADESTQSYSFKAELVLTGE